ncbi:MAG: cytochrome c [Planctomycetota bacterium]
MVGRDSNRRRKAGRVPPVWFSLALAACATEPAREGRLAEGPPPLALEGSAYDAAARVKLPEGKPMEFAGLRHVYRLSGDIVTGGEPEGDRAFRQLADMGIKTILSVDGKVPDAAAAAKHGIRCVHVPIQYRGIAKDELLKLAKVFRELEAPIYTHCFHGEHRGPAAAAVGRLVRDGATREQALAEMRQYGGTSWKYEGLYRAIAEQILPSAAETAAFRWDFPSAHRHADFRQAMVGIARSFDYLEEMARRGWAPDPGHPDIDAANESQKLAGLLADAEALEEVRARPDDFRRRMSEGVEAAAHLRGVIARARAGEAPAADAGTAFRRVETVCSACHANYRN